MSARYIQTRLIAPNSASGVYRCVVHVRKDGVVRRFVGKGKTAREARENVESMIVEWETYIERMGRGELPRDADIQF